MYLIRGNHDAHNRMTRDLRLPENVRVLASDRAETAILEDCGVAIHGRSFATRAVLENLSRSYPSRVSGLFNVGLLHTCLDGREGHEPYAPCTLNDLRAREYGYWALGHIHAREFLHRDDPWIVFPGNIQGRHVREPGAKGCVLVTVGDGMEVVAVEPRWLDVVRWGTCRVEADGARDADEVLGRLERRLGAMMAEVDGRLLAARVEFHGTTRERTRHSRRGRRTGSRKSAAPRSTPARGGSGSRRWSSRPPPAAGAEATARGDAPLAELTSLLDELRGDDDRLRALAERALDDLKRKLPSELLEELEGPERLRALLEQAGPLLFDRLLGRAGAAEV